MDDILRIALPIYLLAYFLIAFVGRSYLVWKRTGINPYVVGKSGDRPIDFVESLYRIPVISLALITMIFSFTPSFYACLAPISWLERDAVKIAGGIFLVGSLIWVALAQIQMGSSWRIGIDANNRSDLVHKGLFNVSRNPIFLGMRASLLGFLLTLPNAFSLASVVLADVLMQIQVRLEEQHLTAEHGEDYEAYSERVRRWI